MDRLHIDKIVMDALYEDMYMGDITTDSLIPEKSVSNAVMIAREEGIIAGLKAAERVFAYMDGDIVFTALAKDGDRVLAGHVIVEMNGSTRSLLKAERTALNLLQRMSGIATLAHKFSERVKGTKAKVVDTRKTTPGLRKLEKYAVRIGGAYNHRFNLSDGVLIKDNHIHACGGIKQAVEKARENIPHTIKIEVEAETLDQVREALEAKADIIMLDNMDNDKMRKAVELIDGKALSEASGNVTLDTVGEIAKTGVDIISAGSLTHSAKALDISMKFR